MKQPRRKESSYVRNLQKKENGLISAQNEVVPRLYAPRVLHHVGTQEAASWVGRTNCCRAGSEMQQPQQQFPCGRPAEAHSLEKGYNI